jgi:hypothetical protein
MDFIEDLFGISPDGGSGAEFMLAVALDATIFVAMLAVSPSLRTHVRSLFARTRTPS